MRKGVGREEGKRSLDRLEGGDSKSGVGEKLRGNTKGGEFP